MLNTLHNGDRLIVFNTGYTPAQIYAELKFVNMTQCKPPLDDRELQTITESVTRYRR